MRRILSLVLVFVLVFTALTCFQSAFAVTVDSSVRKVYPKTFSSEKAAGLLTDEESARVKAIVASGSIKDLDKILDAYFQNCVHESVYVEATRRAITEGTTRYTRSYENSGIFTYQRKHGIWKAIASATISTVLGKIKTVGDILSYTYSVISGYEPDYEKQAEAKTMYSYRYIRDRGQVYYNDGEATAYYTRAEAVSREKYQHEYGYYIDSQGYARQHTRDYSGSIETLDAPHRGNQTWLKNKAYNQWRYDLPSYYEDWND